MDVLETFLDAVGRTPLVRLRRVTEGVRPRIVAKLEMLNPGGSVKDRIGLRMIEAAERAGRLRPGGTIVEPTSGNTGHGLAIAAAIRGYRCIFVMPDKMSQEKISLLRAYGAEVVIAPTAVAPDSPESYYRVADRLTEEIPGAFQPNQYYNDENPAAHETTTGPEIWRQTDGTITAFVCGVGTGGTITGTSRYLKSQKPDLLVVGADPEGSIYSGDVHPYLTEGIGEDFWPTTFDPKLVDRYVRVSDRDAFAMARRITREEGILVGGSSGTAVVAALDAARELGPDDVVVVILPDTGRNYLSKLYSDSWLLQYGLTDRPEVVRVEEVVQTKQREMPPVVTVRARDKVRHAIDVLQEFSISQAPVVREPSGGDGSSQPGDPTDISGFVGSIRENALLDRIFRDPDALQADVAEVMGAPIGMVEFDAPIEVAFEALQSGPALLVVKGGQALGVLTRSDLLEFLAHRRS
ncbi:MAG TPA: cystathionine beta-synthase [Actinomycetota bacterium]|nr:cystathionine beta-synthase [Actinomycetota bacterium]